MELARVLQAQRFEDGIRAYEAGAGIKDNPHYGYEFQGEYAAYSAWIAGWEYAHGELVDWEIAHGVQ